MPMLEEMNYVPTTRYAFGDEIRRHLDAIATKYGLVDDALVPHRGRDERVGRERVALGGPHRSGRRGPGALPRRRARHPQPHEAAGDPGHGQLRGQGVPHRPLGLRVHRRFAGRPAPHEARRQGRRRRRRRRERHPGAAAARRVGEARLRVPAHAVGDRRARQPAHRRGVRGAPPARLAEGADGELQRHDDRPSGRHRSRRRRLDAAHRAPEQPRSSSRAWIPATSRAWSRSSTSA